MELLKDYDINVHYHLGKANFLYDALSWMSMKPHVENGNKELVKDINRLSRLGVRLVDSTNWGVSFHPWYEPSLVVEVKEGHHLDFLLIELKDSMLVKMNNCFALVDDIILRYQDRLCVPDVNDL